MLKYLFNNKLVKFNQNNYLLYEGYNNKAYLCKFSQRQKANFYIHRYFIAIISTVIITSFTKPTSWIVSLLCYMIPICLVIAFDLWFRQDFLAKFTVITKYDPQILYQSRNQHSPTTRILLLCLYPTTIVVLWCLPFTNPTFQNPPSLFFNFILTILFALRTWEIIKSNCQ